MAKEFKEWDKVFSKAEITAWRQEHLYDRLKEQNYDTMSESEFKDLFGEWEYGYNQPSHSDVRFAVYKADDVRDWQLMRVALKGLTTIEKLYLLGHYYNDRVMNSADQLFNFTQAHLAYIRVHNYLGALKRGGQLNSKLEAVK